MHDQGHSADAEAACAAALQQAQALIARGQADAALDLLTPWLKQQSGRLDVLLAATHASHAAGDEDGARTLIARAVEQHPGSAEAHYFAGLLHRDQGRHDAALASLERARALAPQVPEIQLQVGGVHEARWRPDAAEVVYRRLAADAPGFAPGREALARVQLAQAKPFEAEATCRQALADFPDFAPLHGTLGAVLQRRGQLPQAETAYRRALELQPDAAGTWNNLGLVCRQRGDLRGALAALQRGHALAPAMLEVGLNLTDVLTRSGDPAAAVRVCDDCLSHHPRNGTAIAFKAIALRDAGHAAEADRLVDLDRFVSFAELGVPDGYASAEAFHTALAAEVAATPSRASEPGTADGRQTLELFPPQSPALRALHDVLDGAVRDYAARCTADPTHPFLANVPSSWRLSAWATLMRRVKEPETTHLHPPSWLSGVCYVALPGVVDTGADKDGWLEFGRPALNLHHVVEPEIRCVRPEPGRLVLFPGYFFHRVRPFAAEETRISIAFDAVPT